MTKWPTISQADGATDVALVQPETLTLGEHSECRCQPDRCPALAADRPMLMARWYGGRVKPRAFKSSSWTCSKSRVDCSLTPFSSGSAVLPVPPQYILPEDRWQRTAVLKPLWRSVRLGPRRRQGSKMGMHRPARRSEREEPKPYAKFKARLETLDQSGSAAVDHASLQENWCCRWRQNVFKVFFLIKNFILRMRYDSRFYWLSFVFAIELVSLAFCQPAWRRNRNFLA